jgi:hypothetical protein
MALLNIALSSNEYSSSDEPLWAAAGLAVELVYSVQGCAGSSSSSSSTIEFALDRVLSAAEVVVRAAYDAQQKYWRALLRGRAPQQRATLLQQEQEGQGREGIKQQQQQQSDSQQQQQQLAGCDASTALGGNRVHNAAAAAVCDSSCSAPATAAADNAPSDVEFGAVPGCKQALVVLAAVLMARVLAQLQKDSSSSNSSGGSTCNVSRKSKRASACTNSQQQQQQQQGQGSAAAGDWAEQLLTSVGVSLSPDALLLDFQMPLGLLAFQVVEVTGIIINMPWTQLEDLSCSSSSSRSSGSSAGPPAPACAVQSSEACVSATGPQQQQSPPAWLLPLLMTTLEVAAAWPADSEEFLLVAEHCLDFVRRSIQPAPAAFAMQLLPQLICKLGCVAMQADCQTAAACCSQAPASPQQQQQQQQWAAAEALCRRYGSSTSAATLSISCFCLLEDLMLAGERLCRHDLNVS